MSGMAGVHLCGIHGAPSDALRTLVGLASCCYDAATGGPAACSCWEPLYDREQAEPDETVEPTTRETMCDDCAYRPDSPERTGDPSYRPPPESPSDGVFWCHQGMRKPRAWRHRSLGITVDATGDFYDPPILQVQPGRAVPFKADGQPGDRCAGWAAHARAELVAVLAEPDPLAPLPGYDAEEPEPDETRASNAAALSRLVADADE